MVFFVSVDVFVANGFGNEQVSFKLYFANRDHRNLLSQKMFGTEDFNNHKRLCRLCLKVPLCKSLITDELRSIFRQFTCLEVSVKEMTLHPLTNH